MTRFSHKHSILTEANEDLREYALHIQRTLDTWRVQQRLAPSVCQHLRAKVNEAMHLAVDQSAEETTVTTAMLELATEAESILGQELHGGRQPSLVNSPFVAVAAFYLGLLTVWWAAKRLPTALGVLMLLARVVVVLLFFDTTIVSWMTWNREFRHRLTRGTKGCASNVHRPDTSKLVCPATGSNRSDTFDADGDELKSSTKRHSRSRKYSTVGFVDLPEMPVGGLEQKHSSGVLSNQRATQLPKHWDHIYLPLVELVWARIFLGIPLYVHLFAEGHPRPVSLGWDTTPSSDASESLNRQRRRPLANRSEYSRTFFSRPRAPSSAKSRTLSRGMAAQSAASACPMLRL